MGQCLDHCYGSGAATADLSSGNAGCRGDCLRDLHSAFCGDVDYWTSGWRLGNWGLGRCCAIDGRTSASDCSGCGRDDERLWDVQCAGDELLAAAAGYGSGRYAASGFWEVAFKIAGALGGDYCFGYWLGTGFESWVRTAGYA